MDGLRADGFRQVLPWHLAAAWLAVALLYLIPGLPVPEPFVGFLGGTVIGLIGAAAGYEHTAAPHAAPPTAIPQPVAVPPSGPSRAAVPRAVATPSPPFAPLDLAGYGRVEVTERQCPRCGSFAVSTGPGAEASCSVCALSWWQDPRNPPDVVVRSWLH